MVDWLVKNPLKFLGIPLPRGAAGWLGLFLWGWLLLDLPVAAAEPRNTAADGPLVRSLSDEERVYLAGLPSLRVPLVSDQAPLSFAEDGQPAGFLNDLLLQVAGRLGLTVTWVPGVNYQQTLHALARGEVDLLGDYSAYGDSRGEIRHTRPVLSTPFVAVSRAGDSAGIRSMADLAGKRLILVSGYQQTATIRQRYPQQAVLLVDNIDQAYRALRTREGDYYIDNASHAGYHLRSRMVSDLHIAGQLPPDELGELELRFAVNSSQPLLLSALDKALAAISRRDMLALEDKWLLSLTPRHGLVLSPQQRAWLDEHPVIRLASDYAWPPFETIDGRGRYRGIAADYMQLLERRLGIRFVTSPRAPWSDITEMLRKRQLDVFSLAMETEPRREYAIFTRPYVSNPMVIVTDDKVGYVDGLAGLDGRTVAVEQGYASFDLLSREHPELQLKTYPDTLAAMMAVSRGEVFAYIGNIATMSHIARTHAITNVKISGQIPYHFKLAMGVRSDWPELVPILQKALDTISPEEKNAILQRWISVEMKHGPDLALLWQIAAVALLLFLLILWWNLALKRKVRERTAQLQHQAHFDALTGLPNRFLAFDRLSQLISEAQRDDELVALLFLDLDDFKKINDTLGHDAGDGVLVEMAERLRHAVRSGDSVGRLGGDEFIIVLGGLRRPSDAVPVTENLLACFRQAFLHDGRELLFTASIGIAIYPHDGQEPSTLLRNADSAMYHSKQQGRNTFSFYTDAMNLELARRLLVEGQMHGALERGEFSVCYQPKLAIGDRRIVGFEALLRWHNPELGDVSPQEFIPLAEHNGMITAIGRYVLATGLTACAGWQRRFDRDLTLAVNLSPRQFRDPGLVEYIGQVIEEAGISSNSLELEITEGVLMSGHVFVDDALAALKASGVTIAMDDFGTGYSSLSYLRKYPFDTLKIDREFVRDITVNPADQELANAAIAMAHSLGLQVVAEGVETEQQLELLAAQGCDLAQGFLFSRPVPAEQAAALLEDGQGTASAS